MRLDNYELPPNLYWADEFDFSPVSQSVQRAVNGALIVESQALAYGQPITLTGAWCGRDVVADLRSMQSDISVVRVLTLNDGNQYSVVFCIEAGGVQALLLSPESSPDQTTLYKLTINLITVEPE